MYREQPRIVVDAIKALRDARVSSSKRDALIVIWLVRLGEPLLRDPRPLDGVLGLVGGPRLLGALPGEIGLVVALVSVDGSVQSGSLPVSEVLEPAAQDGADAVERVALPAAVAVDLLLHPSANLVQGLVAELDHVESGQNGDGVLEGVLVAVERVKGGDLDSFPGRLATPGQPVPVGGAGAAGDEVQQSCPDLAFLIAAEVDHASELLRAALLNRHVVPDNARPLRAS